MSPLRFTSVGALLAAAALPMVARAAADDVRNDAWLDHSMLQYRQSSSDQVAWQNPHLPQASVAYVAPAATGEDAVDALAGADPTESADKRMARIVARYDQAMLDRGGWENPYLQSAAAGTPLIAVAVGNGVTLPGAQPTRSVAAPKSGAASEEEGAGSGEPEISPQRGGQPRAK